MSQIEVSLYEILIVLQNLWKLSIQGFFFANSTPEEAFELNHLVLKCQRHFNIKSSVKSFRKCLNETADEEGKRFDLCSTFFSHGNLSGFFISATSSFNKKWFSDEVAFNQRQDLKFPKKSPLSHVSFCIQNSRLFMHAQHTTSYKHLIFFVGVK